MFVKNKKTNIAGIWSSSSCYSSLACLIQNDEEYFREKKAHAYLEWCGKVVCSLLLCFFSRRYYIFVLFIKQSIVLLYLKYANDIFNIFVAKRPPSSACFIFTPLYIHTVHHVRTPKLVRF